MGNPPSTKISMNIFANDYLCTEFHVETGLQNGAFKVRAQSWSEYKK